MNLPRELLDEIFNHLPLDYERSLRSCSLVSKSWRESSQRLLFTHISIRNATYKSFLNAISPTNPALRHVRSLTYFTLKFGGVGPDRHVYALQDYLPSFCQLQSLTLQHLDIEPTIPDRLHLFSAFQNALSSLVLLEVSVTWSTFASLVRYFPNLRNLDISFKSFEVDDRPVPPSSRVLRGRLSMWSSVVWIDDGMSTLVSVLPELKPEYEELVLCGGQDIQHRLLAVVQKSLKILTVDCERDMGSPLDIPLNLSDCPELQEIRILDMPPARSDVALISSITSTNFRKVVFRSNFGCRSWNSLLRDPCWQHVDDLLYDLVNRLRLSGYQHTLEVEVRVVESMSLKQGLDDEGFLPRFRKKGRVKMLEGRSGRCFLLS